MRLEFLTRLYFANQLMPKQAPQIYESQAKETARTIRRLRTALAQTPDSQLINRMSIDLRLRQMELIRTWLREIRVRFRIKAGKEK